MCVSGWARRTLRSILGAARDQKQHGVRPNRDVSSIICKKAWISGGKVINVGELHPTRKEVVLWLKKAMGRR
jgi:hypothetical protein